MPSDAPTGSESPSASPDCESRVVVERNDFETGLEEWNTGDTNLRKTTSDVETNFMGDLGKGNQAEKLFVGIPDDANSVSIHFDIYKIGTWNDNGADFDTVKVQVDSTTTMDLGRFNESAFGTTVDGVVWWRSPIRNATGEDKIHHASIKVPTALYKDTTIGLRLFGELSDGSTFGIDNVEVVADYACTCTKPTTIVFEDDFSSYPIDENGAQVRQAGWFNGKIDSDPFFTNFLGRYASQEDDKELFPVKLINVPPHVDSVVVEFDFYEIDAWTKDNYVNIYINGDVMNLGSFSHEEAEFYRNGTSARGIRWVKTGGPNTNLGFNSDYKDQVHHLKMTVPPEVFATGQISLMFEPRLVTDYAVASAGFDNIVVTAEKTCAAVQSRSSVISASSSSSSSSEEDDDSCSVVETEFANPTQCSMGLFGSQHVKVIETNNATTVKFQLTNHGFPSDVSLAELKVWFLDPEKYNELNYHQCWSGVQDGLFAQEFEAKCDSDGYATVRVTGGENELASDEPRFHQRIDVVEPFCYDDVSRPDFNPSKRCHWEFKVPCSCGHDCRDERRNVVETSPSIAPLDCTHSSQTHDVRPIQLDKCITAPSKDTVRIVSQDVTTVTFTVNQKWKGCDGSSSSNNQNRLGWLATDYLNHRGGLECDVESNVQCGLVEMHTATCGDNGEAVVDLYTYDSDVGLFGQTDESQVAIPAACNTSSFDIRGVSAQSCHYRYILQCEPSQCNGSSSSKESLLGRAKSKLLKATNLNPIRRLGYAFQKPISKLLK